MFRQALFIGSLLIAMARLGVSSSFTNGSFESPGGAPIRLALGCNDGTVTGWINNASICTGTQVYESSGSDGINAGNGTYYISWGHNGTTGGTLQQTFDTILGQAYTITYLLTTQQSSCSGPCPQANTVAAYNGTTLTAGNLLNNTSNLFNPNDGVWFSGNVLNFTATGTSTTLLFTDTTTAANSPATNWGLDNVALNRVAGAVPEPVSYLLMGMGLAGLAFIKRLRAQ